jgi:nucleotide-binding universal stress UspA family protein
VLIATDNSDLIRNATQYTAELFPDREFHVISVADTSDRSVEMSSLLMDLRKRLAVEAIDNTAAILEGRGIKPITHMVMGDPSKKVLDYTNEKRVDLLVMATHALTSSSRFHLGGTCKKILGRVRCSSLLFSYPYEIKKPESILNPSTASHYSSYASDIALSLAKEYGASVTSILLGGGVDKEEERLKRLAGEMAVPIEIVRLRGANRIEMCRFINSQSSSHDLMIISRGNRSVAYLFRNLYHELALGDLERELIVESSIPMLVVGD